MFISCNHLTNQDLILLSILLIM